MRDFDKQMEMVLYHSDEGDVSVDAYIMNDSLWITQKAMAELFGVQVPDISKHLTNIYDEDELDKEATVSKMEIVQKEGNRNVRRKPDFYNLDAIISVGYRVNSRKATQFRIWATKVLKEYMIKGFVLDDDRLKQGKTAFGKDYFRDLLERVRSIRASERRIWQQITDIFAECSIDYTRIVTPVDIPNAWPCTRSSLPGTWEKKSGNRRKYTVPDCCTMWVRFVFRRRLSINQESLPTRSLS